MSTQKLIVFVISSHLSHKIKANSNNFSGLKAQRLKVNFQQGLLPVTMETRKV